MGCLNCASKGIGSSKSSGSTSGSSGSSGSGSSGSTTKFSDLSPEMQKVTRALADAGNENAKTLVNTGSYTKPSGGGSSSDSGTKTSPTNNTQTNTGGTTTKFSDLSPEMQEVTRKLAAAGNANAQTLVNTGSYTKPAGTTTTPTQQNTTQQTGTPTGRRHAVPAGKSPVKIHAES